MEFGCTKTFLKQSGSRKNIPTCVWCVCTFLATFTSNTSISSCHIDGRCGNASCACRKRQTMLHIADECPVPKFTDGFQLCSRLVRDRHRRSVPLESTHMRSVIILYDCGAYCTVSHACSLALLYLRILWRYTYAVIIIIIIKSFSVVVIGVIMQTMDSCTTTVTCPPSPTVPAICVPIPIPVPLLLSHSRHYPQSIVNMRLKFNYMFTTYQVLTRTVHHILKSLKTKFQRCKSLWIGLIVVQAVTQESVKDQKFTNGVSWLCLSVFESTSSQIERTLSSDDCSNTALLLQRAVSIPAITPYVSSPFPQ